VGSSERDSSKVTKSITDANTMKFTFTISEGSKIYSGTTAPSTIDGSRVGDIYINSQEGDIYELKSTGWDKQDGSIKGPVGDSLNIIKQVSYKSSTVSESNIAN
jgi:hypothetical protein